MRKPIKCTLAVLYVFFALILQTTVLDSIRIFGIIPNIMLISVICYSLSAADYRGIIFGVASGLLLDITGGRMIGINTLLCMYVAFSCVWMCDKLYNNNEIIAGVFTFVISIIYGAAMYIINFLLWGETNVLYALFRVILPETLYNTILSLFIYPLMYCIANGPRKKRKRRKKDKKTKRAKYA